jgi:aryl-alcohol dehydrogenase-like predicted oxidoreductase
LGGSGLATPPLMLGGNVFGWTADEATSFAVLDRFIAGGGTLIDTADIYTAWIPGHRGGESETVIGNWLARRGRRDDVLIATKAGMKLNGDALSFDLSPAHITWSANQSLQRLRTDYIDLYFIHHDDPKAPLEPTLRALDRLVQDGKVRAIGASNFSAARLTEALDISARERLAAFTVLQPLFNLLEREFQDGLQGLCAARNIAVVPYFGLASGFLTGKYRATSDAQGRARQSRVQSYLNARGWRMLSALDQVAGETNASLAQVALAWLAAQPTIAAPIASATSVAQLDDLLPAMTLTLTPAQLGTLDLVGP